ncbi:MAG: NADH-quinone oxidoreductase subunit C [Proteobacteria bacterium]|nr:NADH-quinone oxidoreductase subunit C [Pseudomonadota bacterium]
MSNKKIQQDLLKGREKAEPQVQTKLRENLEKDFSGKLTRLTNHAWEFGLTYSVSKENAIAVIKQLKDDSKYSFNMLVDVTAVDWLDKKETRFEVVYQFLSISYLHRLCLKMAVPETAAEVDSILSLYPGANFMEREVWDMYGISFKGHGDLRRILMYDEFEGHPLRKDYPILKKQPRVPLRIPELHNSSKDMNRDVLVSLPTRQRFKPITVTK